MPESTKNYELTFILGEAATPELATAKAAELKKGIEAQGGQVTKEEHWGRRDLAYAIQRNRSGIYTTMWLTLPPKEVKALERTLRFDESIIRSLVTVAYTSAQPGSLYPVVEEEVKPRGRRGEKEATATAEEELRRSSTSSKTSKVEDEIVEDDELTEADRLAQLDSRLDSLLHDEESK